MSKLLLRTALIGITFPILYVLIFLLPYLHHLALNIVVAGISFIGAVEVRSLLAKRSDATLPILTPLLGATLPISAYFVNTGVVAQQFFYSWLTICFILVLLTGIIVGKKEKLLAATQRISYSLLIVIYPGFFLSFIVFITGWQDGSLKLLFFLALVFVNDIMAYIFGKLFGKGLNMAVSPHKTVVGFGAGFAGSLGAAAIFFWLFPGLFIVGLPLLMSFAACIGLMTILGDLIESALKRSAGVKDSGTFMLGRGGILDSLDSLMIGAPVFFFLLPLIASQ